MNKPESETMSDATDPPLDQHTRSSTDAASDSASQAGPEKQAASGKTDVAKSIRTRKLGWTYGVVGLLCLVSGLAAGQLLPTDWTRSVVFGDAAMDELAIEPEAEDGLMQADVFDVTLAAQKTIGLEIGLPTIGNYAEQISIPAVVRERPAISNLQASSKLAGIVRKIYVDVGQSVREGDRLMDLELIGDSLAESQSMLLDASKQLEIVQAEIARIAPIADNGGVARKNLLEKQYEEKRLLSLLEAKRQELVVKGFSEEQLASIRTQGQLVRVLTICVPEGIRPTKSTLFGSRSGVERGSSLSLDSGAAIGSRVRSQGELSRSPQVFPVSMSSDDPWVYSIETLRTSPGAVVSPGEPLCDLAFHETLLLEGQAYDRDLPVLTELLQSGVGVSVVLGSDDAPEYQDRVPILYLDNHIDPVTKTVRFYLELKNSVTSETRNDQGYLFRSWKYRPSQRGHVMLDAKRWENELLVPADAVVKDGVEHIVFKHLGRHRPLDEAAHSEFQKLSVTVLYSDRRTAVLKSGGDLDRDDEIALNNAYMLQMQMSQSNSGGGHHHHDH